MLDSISKSEFEQYFDDLFFGESASRLDIQFIGDTHVADMEKAMKERYGTLFGKNMKKQEPITSYEEFDAKMSYYDDMVNVNFVKSR